MSLVVIAEAIALSSGVLYLPLNDLCIVLYNLNSKQLSNRVPLHFHSIENLHGKK